MGRKILLIAGILLFCAGCASHYFQLNGDTLRMYLKGPDAEIVYFSSSLDGYELHKARRVALLLYRGWDCVSSSLQAQGI
jgi:hypothetical protein